jgi:hypothetical protein
VADSLPSLWVPHAKKKKRRDNSKELLPVLIAWWRQLAPYPLTSPLFTATKSLKFSFLWPLTLWLPSFYYMYDISFPLSRKVLGGTPPPSWGLDLWFLNDPMSPPSLCQNGDPSLLFLVWSTVWQALRGPAMMSTPNFTEPNCTPCRALLRTSKPLKIWVGKLISSIKKSHLKSKGAGRGGSCL